MKGRNTSQKPPSVTRILVVDDHPVVREGLTRIIDNEPDLTVCGQAAGLSQAMQQFRETKPDLVLVDLSLENGSGLDLIKELVAQDSDVKVLVASMHDETLYAQRALRAGSRGYVNKDQAPETIVAAIRRVLAGHVYLSEQMTDRMLCQTVGGVAEQFPSPVNSLSDRELGVFEHIGHGITTRKIAVRLHLSPKTIETYRENIKTKLNLKDASELTQHAVRWVLDNEG